MLAEGNKRQLERLIAYLRTGPPTARVEGVEATWSEYTGRYSTFAIAPTE